MIGVCVAARARGGRRERRAVAGRRTRPPDMRRQPASSPTVELDEQRDDVEHVAEAEALAGQGARGPQLHLTDVRDFCLNDL
jgi:hypothetical protein